MAYKEIDALLEKYLEGLTSSEEEQYLRDFLAKTDGLKPEWLYAKTMLGHFEAEKQVSFEAPVHRLEVQQKQRTIWRLSGIAATILILLSAGWFYFQPVDQPVTYAYINGKAVTEKSVALEEMKMALELMSRNLNEGQKGLEKLSKLEEIRQSVSKKKQQ